MSVQPIKDVAVSSPVKTRTLTLCCLRIFREMTTCTCIGQRRTVSVVALTVIVYALAVNLTT